MKTLNTELQPVKNVSQLQLRIVWQLLYNINTKRSQCAPPRFKYYDNLFNTARSWTLFSLKYMCTVISWPKTSLHVCNSRTLVNILTLQFRTITKHCTTKQHFTDWLQQQNDDISIAPNRSAEAPPFYISAIQIF